MTGYVRKDTTNNIADGNVINAADLDSEFDGVQAAFNSSTGHTHDGTASEGAPITKLGPAQDVTISTTVLGVKTTNTVDLGTSSLKFKDFYLAGNALIGGTLGVTSTATFTGAVIFNGNATIGDADTDTITQAASYVTGTQLKSAKAATNTLSLAAYDVDGTAYTNLITLTASNTPTLALTSTGVGTINNMSIGATTASTGAFTTLSTTGAVTSGSDFKVPTLGYLYAYTGAGAGTVKAGFQFDGAGAIYGKIADTTVTNISSTGLAVTGSLNVTKSGGSLSTLTQTSATGYGLIIIPGADTVYDAFTINNAANTLNQIQMFGNGNAIFKGDVGIGTTSPVEKVQSSKGIAATGANQSVGSLNGFVADYSSGASRIFASRNGVASSTLELWTTDSSGTANKNATLDSSGNLGLGVTPSAWVSSWRAIQLAGTSGNSGGSIYTNAGGTTGQIGVAQNWYWNGTNNLYLTTAAASDYYQYAGTHVWRNAASGTAGNTVSLTQAMTLDVSGNLGIGVTSPTSRLHVSNSSASTNAIAQFTNGTTGTGAGNGLYVGIDSTNTATIFNFYNSNLQFGTNGTTKMVLDTSGNLGIGGLPYAYTGYSSETKAIDIGAYGVGVANTGGYQATFANNAYYNAGWKYKAAGYQAALYEQNSGAHYWYGGSSTGAVNGTISNFASPKMTLTTAGDLAIGATSSGGYRLRVVSSGTNGISCTTLGSTTSNPSQDWYDSTNSTEAILSCSSGQIDFGAYSNHPLVLRTNNTERARIDSSGNFGIGTTNPTKKLTVSGTVLFEDASGNGLVFNGCLGDSFGGGAAGTIFAADPLSSGSFQFWRCTADYNGTPQVMAYLYANGGFANYSGFNTNLSDIRVKQDIQLAGSYLEKICAIPVKTFRYKSQLENDQDATLGVIAQDVEAVAPELVNTSGFGDTPDDGIPLKSIYQTDLQYALMKCIQEQQALITQLTARITALEGA